MDKNVKAENALYRRIQLIEILALRHGFTLRNGVWVRDFPYTQWRIDTVGDWCVILDKHGREFRTMGEHGITAAGMFADLSIWRNDSRESGRDE